jgi:uncharacterized protein (TIGR03086 family)
LINEAMEELTSGVGLLERAVSYVLGSLTGISDDELCRPTPCAGWDVFMLIQHLSDSVEALQQGIDRGHVARASAPPGPGDATNDPAAALRERTCSLLGAWTSAGRRDRPVSIGDMPLMASSLAYIGAIELTVHGWDIARACGRAKAIPATLATSVLEIAKLTVIEGERYPLFAEPIRLSPLADPGDRLIAFLGRDPTA